MKVVKDILLVIIGFVVYVSMRLIKSPLFWLPIPTFYAWKSYEDGKHVKADFVTFSHVLGVVLSFYGLSFFLLWYWSMVIVSASYVIGLLVWLIYIAVSINDDLEKL